MAHGPTQRKAVFIIEATCAMVLLALLLGFVAYLVIGQERLRDHMTAERRLQLAAEGQMERYRAGEPLPDGECHISTPHGIQLDVSCEPGQGDWSGLTRVTIMARTPVRHAKTASFRLVAYVCPSPATIRPGEIMMDSQEQPP